MQGSSGLRQIERRVWLRTFEHGLWDLLIGLFLASFGASILTGFYALSPIWVAVLFPLMQQIGRRIVAPRIGRATFRGRRKRSLIRVNLILAALALAGGGMFAFTAFATREAAPEWAIWVRSHFIVVIGLIWGGALAIAGWAVNYPRLYAYGGLLFGALLAVDLIPTGYHLGHALVAVGGLIALVGAGLFVRFLRRYPRHPEPVDGVDDA